MAQRALSDALLAGVLRRLFADDGTYTAVEQVRMYSGEMSEPWVVVDGNVNLSEEEAEALRALDS